MANAIIHVPNELFAPAESAHFEGETELSVVKAGPDLYSFPQPLVWQVDVTNTGEALLVEGSCDVLGVTSCARCGEPAEVPLFGEIEGYFLIDLESAHPEDLEEDEFDVLPESHDMDLEPLIMASFMLDIPAIPLCQDGCKGLCLSCGANLNEGPCGCVPAEAAEPEVSSDNPFAVLKGLKLED